MVPATKDTYEVMLVLLLNSYYTLFSTQYLLSSSLSNVFIGKVIERVEMILHASGVYAYDYSCATPDF